jgi:hypothetical protein
MDARNRLSSHHINIATTPIQQFVTKKNIRATATTCPKRKKMKLMAKRQNDDHPQPLRPPSLTHRAPSTPKRPVPSSPSLQEWDATPRARLYADGQMSEPLAYGLTGAAPNRDRWCRQTVGAETATPRAAGHRHTPRFL